MIERKGFMGILYTIMEWITRIAYINILWILFSILGLFILGLAPASVAVFTITRRWVMGDTDLKIFSIYWNTYRSEFIKSNLTFWPLIFVGYILYIDFQYLALFNNTLYYILLFVFIIATILYLVVCIYTFPVYVHFKKNLFQNYKQSLIIGYLNPFTTVLMGLFILVLALILERFLGLIPFFSVSVISFIIMWFSYHAFIKLEKKIHKNTE